MQVIADIESTAPIDGRTQASLSLQGITGLLFIDLQQDRNATAPGGLVTVQLYQSCTFRLSILASNET